MISLFDFDARMLGTQTHNTNEVISTHNDKVNKLLKEIHEKSNDAHMRLISESILPSNPNDMEFCEPLLEVLNQEKDGGVDLLKNANSVFKLYKLTGSIEHMVGFSKNLLDAHALKAPLQRLGLQILGFCVDSTVEFGNQPTRSLDIKPSHGVIAEPCLNKLFVLKSLSLVLQSNQNERIDTTTLNKLFSEKYNYRVKSTGPSQREILNLLNEIPPTERLTNLDDIHHYMNSEMSLYEKFLLLKESASIPQNKRALILQNFFFVISNRNFTPKIKIMILREMAKIPKDDLDSVAAHCLQLLNPMHPSLDKTSLQKEILDVIKAIASLPKKQRDGLISRALEIYHGHQKEVGILDYFLGISIHLKLSDILFGLSLLPEAKLHLAFNFPTNYTSKSNRPFTEFCSGLCQESEIKFQEEEEKMPFFRRSNRRFVQINS